MKVFRLCNKEEIDKINKCADFNLLGKSYQEDSVKNTHKYDREKRYMHFFKDEISVLFLSPRKGKFICEYDIPDDILKESEGYGNYADFVNFAKILRVPEYAIPSEKMKKEFLKRVYLIKEDLDFDYFPKREEIARRLLCVFDFSKTRKEVNSDDIER